MVARGLGPSVQPSRLQPGRDGRVQIPLMFAFRDAFEHRDAKGIAPVTADGEVVVSDRSGAGPRGTRRSSLKRDLGHDLGMLVETIALESTEDLSSLPHVRASILNFGIPDIASLTIGSEAEAALAEKLSISIRCHERRLRPESVVVERLASEADAEQRTRYKVTGEMLAKPVDLPVEFVAELDTAAGKVVLSR